MSRPTHPFIKVAVGILISADHKVLVSLRPAHTPHGGLWEFPGGKFEKNETTLQALTRELTEEIGIEVVTASPLICVKHTYGTVSVELDTWQVTAYRGTPYGRENQEIRWVDRHALSQLQFPEGNRLIVEKILSVLAFPTPV